MELWYAGGAQAIAFHRGVNALDERRFERARAYFAEHLERHPERPETWRLAGHAWASGSYQSATRAVEHWRRYLELRPDDVEIQVRLIGMLLVLGEWREAQDRSQRLDDSAGSRVLRARAWLETDPERAAETIAAARDSADDDPRLHATAAEIYLRTGDREQALADAARAVELAPLDAKSTYLLARLLKRRRGRRRAARHPPAADPADRHRRRPGAVAGRSPAPAARARAQDRRR